MKRLTKIGAIGGTLVMGAVILGACSFGGTSTPSAVQKQSQISGQILKQLEQSQPIPQYKYSQLRQTLIDIENAQAGTVQTTSFFFNMGVTAPTGSCPSIGFPVPADDQLTSPDQAVWNTNNDIAGATISQIDPNGVYSGVTTGTYVVCVASDGSTYLDYWEGFVQTVTGPATWNATTNTIKLTGKSTVNVQTSTP